jgi:predicted membrane-bound spermidine synthase
MVRFAWVLSMAVGFLSLSQEILWVRLISFTLKGLSQSFAVVLFFFLLGIAVGSAVGKRFCERHDNLLKLSAVVLAAAAVVDVSLVLLLPSLLHWQAGLAGVLLLVALTAALKSIMFPIAHHLGSQQSGTRIGRSVSKVYFGNIIGSTLGPIVTGYVLLDNLTIDSCLVLVGICTGVLSLLCAARAGNLAPGLIGGAAVALISVFAWRNGPSTIQAIALATQRNVVPGTKIEHVVQNRHGIIHTVSTPDREPDTILGGNIYDGRIHVDMSANYNGLDRALVLLAVHPNPERVLVVGLSTGAWVRILSASPRIKHMTVVEINPGYLEVIKQYPQVIGLLKDRRIEIVIDDGRRWLRRNPAEHFDLIVQNTTFYWRAYSTNLLSREYLQLVAAHLRPGGIAAFNSTLSSDVLQTAVAVFPFVERRSSFIYGSGADFARATAAGESAFRELALDGTPVFAEQAFRPGGLAREMLDAPFVPSSQRYAGMSESPGVITDQNLLVEQAHGKMREFLPGLYRAIEAGRSVLHR